MITCLEFILFGAVSAEDVAAACRSNDSLFVLMGNPGIIWHAESNQCIHTKMNTIDLNYGFNNIHSKTGMFFSFLNFESIGDFSILKEKLNSSCPWSSRGKLDIVVISNEHLMGESMRYVLWSEKLFLSLTCTFLCSTELRGKQQIFDFRILKIQKSDSNVLL